MEGVEFTHIDSDQRYSQRPRNSSSVVQFETWFVLEWFVVGRCRPQCEGHEARHSHYTSVAGANWCTNLYSDEGGVHHTESIEVVRMIPVHSSESQSLNLLSSYITAPALHL